MKLESKFTIECHCGETKVFDSEREALYFALSHIKRCHKRLYARVDKQGREAAKEREGLGYLDYDWPRRGLAEFRKIWRTKALKRMLLEGKAR